MKPVVLITSIPRPLLNETLRARVDNATVAQGFGRFVADAGGIPFVSDVWADPADIVRRVDAILLNGGYDIAPERYGQERLPTTDPPNHERDEFELALIQRARERGIPVLGVCRGCQLINVACGGTLIQSLPTEQFDHFVIDPFDRPVHQVEVAADSRLGAAIAVPSLEVNSIHHQAVDRPGDGLRVVARAPEGVAEAIEDADGRLFGVQWHPEFMYRSARDAHIGIFRLLVQACS